MAAFDIIRPGFGSTTVAELLVRGTSRLVGTFADWNDARVTRKALSRLSDRELADIGLIRGEIDTVARTHFIR